MLHFPSAQGQEQQGGGGENSLALSTRLRTRVTFSIEGAISDSEEAVPDVLLCVLRHLAKPDHATAAHVFLQLSFRQFHQPGRPVALGPHQQHVASMTTTLKQHRCKTEEEEEEEVASQLSGKSVEGGGGILTLKGDDGLCAVGHLQKDIGERRMEKIQVLLRCF